MAICYRLGWGNKLALDLILLGRGARMEVVLRTVDGFYIYGSLEIHGHEPRPTILRCYAGSAGLGVWTVVPIHGWYASYYCKPIGPGARKGTALDFQVVPRLVTTRRSGKACRERSLNLAMGRLATASTKRKPKPNNNPPGTGYCMKEKKHVLIENPRQWTANNGRLMIVGRCPDCHTKIQKYGRLIDCPECERHNVEAGANDYICRACRITVSASH